MSEFQLEEMLDEANAAIKQLQQQLDQLKQLEDEMQKYIYVATMAACFVDLMPEHVLYESIRQDLKASLQALKENKDGLD